MRPDVIDLRDFYTRGLGQVTQRRIGVRIRALWPNVRGERVLGLGYATPYLGTFIGEADRVVAMMPGQQGVERWPVATPARVVLGDELAMPFPDAMFDRVLLVHAFECATHLDRMLREVWRVMAPSGRILIVAPNRRSIWARSERTPFGHGHPYTVDQMTRTLRNNMFAPTQWRRSLFLPPLPWAWTLRVAPSIERFAAKWLPAMGGVLVVEAIKQIYAGTPSLSLPVQRRVPAFPQPQAVARDGLPSLRLVTGGTGEAPS